MKIGILLGVVVGLFVLVMLPGAATVAGEHSGARTPTPTPVTLFEDDFETYSNRWRVIETPKAGVAYRDGALRFRISSPGVSVWSVPDFDVPLTRYSLQMTVTVHAATPDAWFGVVVRHASDEQFYALVFWPRGAWQFLRRDGATWVNVTPDSHELFAGVSLSSAVDLRLDVGQETVVITVDGRRIGAVTFDESEIEGVFGVIAQAGKGYLDVSFDNLVVSGASRP